MSINTAHAQNNGIVIYSGELILLFIENVSIEFPGQHDPIFKGSKHGSLYLTTHRMIFNAKRSSDEMRSFSFPFVCLDNVEVQQPVFGANYIRGKVRAQQRGNFAGVAIFKIMFKKGGAIEFGQAMLRAAQIAQQNSVLDEPPPYTPSDGDWYQAPSSAYMPTPGYYNWLPTNTFPNSPSPNTVYMYDAPPPYPGIGYHEPAYQQQGQQQPAYSYPVYPPQYGYSPQGNYPRNDYSQSNPGYQHQYEYPHQPPAGYPVQGSYQQHNHAQSYPPHLPQAGYPPQPRNNNASLFGKIMPTFLQGRFPPNF